MACRPVVNDHCRGKEQCDVSADDAPVNRLMHSSEGILCMLELALGPYKDGQRSDIILGRLPLVEWDLFDGALCVEGYFLLPLA